MAPPCEMGQTQAERMQEPDPPVVSMKVPQISGLLYNGQKFRSYAIPGCKSCHLGEIIVMI